MDYQTVIDEQCNGWLSQLRNEYYVYVKRSFVDV